MVVDAAGEIYGDVANIAARVQALAEPGAVLVTARVQRQVAGLFVAEERGTHTLKGVPEPVALFRLVRASGGGRRSGQRHLTPLVGRDDEMAMLMRRWERARQGDGQLVLIVGEPGFGKSRLIEEFHARLADTPHTWVEWSCSQLLQNTPLHPIAEWGRQRFGGADVPAERRLAELESSLAQVKLDPAENVPLLAPLLDIPLPHGTRAGFGARGIAPPAIGGADQLGDGGREGTAGRAGIRGSALGRSDHARRAAWHRRARRAGAALHPGDDAAGVPAALGHALASRHHLARAARSRPRCATWWQSFPPATRCRRRSSRTWPRAPAACRCSSRKSHGFSLSAASRVASRRFRRRCNNRSRHGSTGSAVGALGTGEAWPAARHHHVPTHLKHAQVHRSKAAEARHYKHGSKHSKRYARLRQSKRHHVARATVPSVSSPVERPAASLPPGLAAVKQALELVRLHKAREATALATSFGDPVAQKLVEWALLRHAESEAQFERYATFIRANPDWPSIPLLRRRAEVRL